MKLITKRLYRSTKPQKRLFRSKKHRKVVSLSSDILATLYYELVQAFKLLDRDNDGVVMRSDLESLLIQLGADPAIQLKVSLILNEVDTEGDGCICLEALTRRVENNSADISADISVDSRHELVQAFKLIDRNNDGVILKSQLEAVLTQLGAEPSTQEEVSLMMREMDREGDGCITLEAFMSGVGNLACDREDYETSDLKETFDFFDMDRDGKITAEELLSAFNTVDGDDGCTLEDCRRMIKAVDKYNKGFVCFEDFSKMMEEDRW